MNAAEAGALRWLTAHPEASDPNRIDIPRFVPFCQQVDRGFFTDPTTSQLKGVLLRNAAREGDHWLVTIEGPSRQVVTLVIIDHDQLVGVRRRTP